MEPQYPYSEQQRPLLQEPKEPPHSPVEETGAKDPVDLGLPVVGSAGLTDLGFAVRGLLVLGLFVGGTGLKTGVATGAEEQLP